LARRPAAPDRRRFAGLFFSNDATSFTVIQMMVATLVLASFVSLLVFSQSLFRILPISLENPLMRTCADDACGEAIHDPVNDKLPPWPKDHDRRRTPTPLADGQPDARRYVVRAPTGRQSTGA
jgi:hypothetical protein